MSEQTSIPQKQKVQSQKNELDLTIGNPIFMQEYWNTVAKYYNGSMGMLKMHSNECMPYNYAQINEKLKNTIVKIHETYGNAETAGRVVVIGNGASQLVSAAAYAIEMIYGPVIFLCSEPYWPRIKFLLAHGKAASSRDFLIASVERKESELIIAPNNPDGSMSRYIHSESEFPIYDFCYNWPQYTKVVKSNEELAIFGLAKATGHAGTRLGWALVKNAEIAEKMRLYVELTTSGVSEEAQQRGYIVLDTIMRLQKDSFINCFDYAKQELDSRWRQLLQKAPKDLFAVVNTGGMFAWCKCSNLNNIQEKLNIKVLDGQLFGSEYENYFRISMGSSAATFADFIDRLTKYGN